MLTLGQNLPLQTLQPLTITSRCFEHVASDMLLRVCDGRESRMDNHRDHTFVSDCTVLYIR